MLYYIILKFSGRKSLVEARGQRRIVRLVGGDRKVTQILTECTCQTLKYMGYSSRRQQQQPLLPSNKRKVRLQYTGAHQILTIEYWKNTGWANESNFCCNIQQKSEAGIYETGDIHTGCWWCNSVEDVVLAHFGPHNTNWASFKHHMSSLTQCTLIDYFLLDNTPYQNGLTCYTEIAALKRPP